jgi:hypothetical protein
MTATSWTIFFVEYRGQCIAWHYRAGELGTLLWSDGVALPQCIVTQNNQPNPVVPSMIDREGRIVLRLAHRYEARQASRPMVCGHPLTIRLLSDIDSEQATMAYDPWHLAAYLILLSSPVNARATGRYLLLGFPRTALHPGKGCCLDIKRHDNQIKQARVVDCTNPTDMLQLKFNILLPITSNLGMGRRPAIGLRVLKIWSTLVTISHC